MIFKSEETDKKEIIVECDCGCEAIRLSKYDWEDDTPDYYLELIACAFYTEQHGFFSKLKNRLKLVWFILTKGHHRLTTLVLTDQNIIDLKKALEDF